MMLYVQVFSSGFSTAIFQAFLIKRVYMLRPPQDRSSLSSIATVVLLALFATATVSSACHRKERQIQES